MESGLPSRGVALWPPRLPLVRYKNKIIDSACFSIPKGKFMSGTNSEATIMPCQTQLYRMGSRFFASFGEIPCS